MNLRNHPILEKLYKLSLLTEKLPASELHTDLIIMISEICQEAEELVDELVWWGSVVRDRGIGTLKRPSLRAYIDDVEDMNKILSESEKRYQKRIECLEQVFKKHIAPSEVGGGVTKEELISAIESVLKGEDYETPCGKR